MKPKFKQFLKKRTIMLLFSVLASVTMWADNVNYFDPTAAEGQQNPTVDATEFDGSNTVLSTGWYYVSGEVTCNNRIEVNGTVNIILVDDGRLNANRGIHLTEGNTLNIWAQSEGSGYLYVQSDSQYGIYYNAIGGNSGPASITEDPGENGENAGDLNIYGGYIVADGQIGGGNGGDGHDEMGWEDVLDEWDNPTGEQYEVLRTPGIGGNGGNGGTICIYGGYIHFNDGVGAGIGGTCQGTWGDDGIATIKLSWSKATDRIYINTYLGAVTLLKEFTETNGEIYSADSQHNNGDGINGRTLMPSVGDSYSVTIAGGYDPSCLTASRSTVKEGVTITLTAVNHYVINSLTVKDASNQTVSTSGSGNGPWTFTMPGSNVTVTPTATRYYSITKDATVNLSADDSDKLQQSGHTYYRPGATISFTLNIAEDKDLQSVSVTCNGQPVSYNQVGDTYTFSMQSGDVTITPTYETIGYTIGKQYYMTLSTASGNVTTRNGKDYYKAGAEITVTLNIPDCYRLDNFRVNYGAVSATDNGNNSFTFDMPAADVTLSASYSIDPSAVLTLGGTSDFTVTGGTSEHENDEGYDKLLDGETSTNWHVWGYWDNGYACYVEFQTAAPVIPKGYKLTTASYDNFIYCQGKYTPNAWTFQAKLDENDAWVTIADVSDGWLSDGANVTSTFNFENRGNNAYQYFRFEVKGTKGFDQEEYMLGTVHYSSEDMLLSEMQLLVKGTENITAKENDGLYWTTYYNGTKGYRIDDENACAYTATYASNTLTLHKLGKVIPANTAVIIVDEDNSISMNPSLAAGENNVSNDLKGVDVSTAKSTLGTGTFYVLSKKGDDFGFFQYTGTNIPAHKAYLLVDGGAAQGRGLTMVFDNETTSINEEFLAKTNDKAERRMKNEEEWFALDGRRLNGKPTTKGMYINNGRKVVIK